MSKKKTVALTLCLLMLLMLWGCGKSQEQAGETVAKKVPVTVETVQKGSLIKSVPLGGLLTPQEEVSLAAKLPTAKIVSVPVKVGDNIAAGTPLVIFDSRDLDLQLEQARLSYERNKELYDSGAVSKAQLEQVQSAYDVLKLQRENLVLTSPIGGIVSAVSAVEGQLAGALPLVSIVNIDRLKLQVQVGELHISKLIMGGEMDVHIPSLSKDPYKGVITVIAPQIDARTKAFPVTLEIVNKDGTMKGGMYGEVQLITDKKDNIIVIPQQAIIDIDDKKVVYAVENGAARMKTVQVGLSLGDQAEITKGINTGEQLIVEGQYGVKDGTPVTPIEKGGI